MIVYPLTCPDGHFFEGWFASAEAFDRQARSGELLCPTCSTAEVRKLPSAPHVHTSASAPADAVNRDMLLALRKLILANTEDVGRKFAELARRMHYKEADPRNIRGVVTPDEAEELHEEGIETFSISSEVIATEEFH